MSLVRLYLEAAFMPPFLRRENFHVGLFKRGCPVAFHQSPGILISNNLSVIHHNGMGKALSLINVGRGNNNRHPRGFIHEFPHQRPELPAGKRIHAGGRFIKNE